MFWKKKKNNSYISDVRLYNKEGKVVFEGDASSLEKLVKYKEMHQDLAMEYCGVVEELDTAIDDKLSLLQRIDKLEGERAKLGNALFEIINSETKVANGTTKRIINIAKAAVNSCEVI